MSIVRIAIAAVCLCISAMAPARADDAVGAPVHIALAAPAKLAPADEYFGPLRLSVLGIRNALVKAIGRADASGIDRIDRYESMRLIETSIHEWEAKYPRDSWLPRTVFALHRAYRQLDDRNAADHAIDVAMWLINKYPESAEAHSLRAALAGAPDTGPAAPAPGAELPGTPVDR